MGRFFSAHVGINYAGSGNDLGGCVNDAKDLSAVFGPLAKANGGTSDRLLERSADIAGLRDFLAENVGRLEAGDLLFLSRSGHGTQVPDRDGDEQDRKDEAFVCFGMDLMLDDEFAAILSRRKAGSQVVVFDDCCHSGGGSRLLGVTATGRPRFVLYSACQPCERSPIARGDTRDGVLHLSACQPQEVALDTGENGAATLALIASIKAKVKTWASLFGGMTGQLPTRQYPQTPTMTGDMEVAKLAIPTVPSAAPPPVTPPPVMLGLPDVLTINGLRYRREA